MRTITFTLEAIVHLEEWKFADLKMIQKIISLVIEASSNPFTGTGKPEPLRFNLKGKWSRRINQEHRLVYEVTDKEIIVISCRYHY